MSKTQDRKQIVQAIEDAADLYRKNLVGKRFMYVFDNRYIEVIYKSENFRHLTGVESPLSAKRFYSYAARRMLTVSQINFNSTHPYALCARKVKHIREVATLAGSESLMLEEITTQTKTYKFGTTDLNFTLCMDKEYDSSGNEKGDCYVVQSLRDEDCFSKSKDVFEVTHIFVRPNDSKKYDTLLYQDPRYSVSQLPEEILSLLNDDLHATFQKESNADRAKWVPALSAQP